MSHIEAVVRRVHDLLADQVEAAVSLTTYGGDVVQLRKLPALVLYLPAAKWNRTEADNQPEQLVDQAAGTITEWAPPRSQDMVFRYELVADPLTLSRLMERMAQFYMRNGAITVERPARLGGTESVTYTLLESQEPAPAGGDGDAHRLVGQFTVKDVEIRDDGAGVTGKLAKTITFTLERKEG